MPFTGFRSGARVHTRDPHEAWHERTSSHSAWASLLVLLPAVVVLSDNEVWSLYGAPWLQPVATRRKSQRLRSRRNTRKPLPTVCRSQRMVRRGSTVRVRQRALKPPQNSRFCCLIWYNRAPPSKGGDRGSTAARHLRELLEITQRFLGAPAALRSWDRFWGLMTAGLGRWLVHACTRRVIEEEAEVRASRERTLSQATRALCSLADHEACGSVVVRSSLS
jgi:hypothetical protein